MSSEQSSQRTQQETTTESDRPIILTDDIPVKFSASDPDTGKLALRQTSPVDSESQRTHVAIAIGTDDNLVTSVVPVSDLETMLEILERYEDTDTDRSEVDDR